MIDTRFDVIAVGNAIVDVLSQQPDSFIEEFNLTKGSMTLIDSDRAVELHEAMDNAIEISGGSAANTAVGVASFGGSSAFIGKVRDDRVGDVFRSDIRSAGVAFDVPPVTEGLATARSMIIVTPDAERTQNTSLGVATTLYPDDIDEAAVAASSILYCEGYLWDVPVTKDAIRVAIAAARGAGRKVSFTLSDGFCVERHHAEWLELLDGSIDVLFGNLNELEVLAGTADLEKGIEFVRGRAEVAVITRSEKGSVIVTADDTIEVAAEPVENVIDTTGAGDLFAAGFLYGLTSGCDLAECGRLASVAAAEVISHVGARPQVALSSLI